MDRKTKILLSVLNRNNVNRSDFLNIPNHEGRRTDENERDISISNVNEVWENKNPFKNSHGKTPEITLQVKIDNVSSYEKVYDTRLQHTVRKLFKDKEETSLTELYCSEKLGTTEVSSTTELMNKSSESCNSSETEYIPDTPSDESYTESGSKYNFCNDEKGYPSENRSLLSVAEHTEPSTSLTDVLGKHPADFGKYKNNGEVRKGNKKTDFCFYCETSVLNFARHITRNHSLEIEVQKILSLPPGSKERKQLLDLLRKRGNFSNSSNVSKPIQSLRTRTDTLPCDNCLGFFSAKFLWRHRNKCTNSKSKNHQSAGQNILLSNVRIDPHLKNTVFPRMRADEISLVAKKDPLICAYAVRYLQCHREKHFVNVVSRKMREISRLLIELKKMEPTIECLFDALKPKHFDLIVAATKAVAKYDVAKDKYFSPTYALNMGTYLKQCADIAILLALKRKNIAETVSSAEAEADFKTFIKVVESQWQYEISSHAASDLSMKKWNKVTLVPLASDLKLLKNYLISKGESAAKALNNNGKMNEYKVLLETVFCRVILLNRRRPGELQRLRLDTYETNNSNSTYEEFSDLVSPTEKILLNRFKRIVIRGKRGRGVPVLFSPDTQEHIKVLLKFRKKFVDEKNIFLFGNPQSTEPICGYKVLKLYASASGAKYPSAITATRLRKHLATLTQIFDMTENDLEQLANFMGHTIGVHRANYRLPDDVFQTAKISKLLILMEKGQAAQFKGQTLNDIDVNLDEDLMEDTEDETRGMSPPFPEMLESSSSRTPEKHGIRIQKKNRRVLIKWNSPQKKLLLEYFKNHIINKKAPKKHECEKLKDLNPGVFENKDWPKLKVFVQNEYKKKS